MTEPKTSNITLSLTPQMQAQWLWQAYKSPGQLHGLEPKIAAEPTAQQLAEAHPPTRSLSAKQRGLNVWNSVQNFNSTLRATGKDGIFSNKALGITFGFGMMVKTYMSDQYKDDMAAGGSRATFAETALKLRALHWTVGTSSVCYSKLYPNSPHLEGLLQKVPYVKTILRTASGSALGPEMGALGVLRAAARDLPNMGMAKAVLAESAELSKGASILKNVIKVGKIGGGVGNGLLCFVGGAIGRYEYKAAKEAGDAYRATNARGSAIGGMATGVATGFILGWETGPGALVTMAAMGTLGAIAGGDIDQDTFGKDLQKEFDAQTQQHINSMSDKTASLLKAPLNERMDIDTLSKRIEERLEKPADEAKALAQKMLDKYGDTPNGKYGNTWLSVSTLADKFGTAELALIGINGAQAEALFPSIDHTFKNAPTFEAYTKALNAYYDAEQKALETPADAEGNSYRAIRAAKEELEKASAELEKLPSLSYDQYKEFSAMRDDIAKLYAREYLRIVPEEDVEAEQNRKQNLEKLQEEHNKIQAVLGLEALHTHLQATSHIHNQHAQAFTQSVHLAGMLEFSARNGELSSVEALAADFIATQDQLKQIDSKLAELCGYPPPKELSIQLTDGTPLFTPMQPLELPLPPAPAATPTRIEPATEERSALDPTTGKPIIEERRALDPKTDKLIEAPPAPAKSQASVPAHLQKALDQYLSETTKSDAGSLASLPHKMADVSRSV